MRHPRHCRVQCRSQSTSTTSGRLCIRCLVCCVLDRTVQHPRGVCVCSSGLNQAQRHAAHRDQPGRRCAPRSRPRCNPALRQLLPMADCTRQHTCTPPPPKHTYASSSTGHAAASPDAGGHHTQGGPPTSRPFSRCSHGWARSRCRRTGPPTTCGRVTPRCWRAGPRVPHPTSVFSWLVALARGSLAVRDTVVRARLWCVTCCRVCRTRKPE